MERERKAKGRRAVRGSRGSALMHDETKDKGWRQGRGREESQGMDGDKGMQGSLAW